MARNYLLCGYFLPSLGASIIGLILCAFLSPLNFEAYLITFFRKNFWFHDFFGGWMGQTDRTSRQTDFSVKILFQLLGS